MSRDPDTARVPEGDQAMLAIFAVWKAHAEVLSSPPGIEYRTIFPLESPAASIVPSGEKASFVTLPRFLLKFLVA